MQRLVHRNRPRTDSGARRDPAAASQRRHPASLLWAKLRGPTDPIFPALARVATGNPLAHQQGRPPPTGDNPRRGPAPSVDVAATPNPSLPAPPGGVRSLTTGPGCGPCAEGRGPRERKCPSAPTCPSRADPSRADGPQQLPPPAGHRPHPRAAAARCASRRGRVLRLRQCARPRRDQRDRARGSQTPEMRCMHICTLCVLVI